VTSHADLKGTPPRGWLEVHITRLLEVHITRTGLSDNTVDPEALEVDAIVAFIFFAFGVLAVRTTA